MDHQPLSAQTRKALAVNKQYKRKKWLEFKERNPDYVKAPHSDDTEVLSAWVTKALKARIKRAVTMQKYRTATEWVIEAVEEKLGRQGY